MKQPTAVVSCAPLRLSLGGGGTDLQSFYSIHGGMAVGASLTGGVLVWLGDGLLLPNEDWAARVRRVAARDDAFALAALGHFGITDSPSLASFGSVEPGTGLGSSASYLVALVAAISRRYDLSLSPVEIAHHSYLIERDSLDRIVGLQDHYLSAFGGLRCLRIDASGSVNLESLPYSAGSRESLARMLSFFYAGERRDGSRLLAAQDNKVRARASIGADIESALLTILHIAEKVRAAVIAGDYREVGRLLHQHWMAKRGLSAGISSSIFDNAYSLLSSDNRFLGGKVSGAGGGGFVALFSTIPLPEIASLLRPYGYRPWHLAVGDWGVFSQRIDDGPLPDPAVVALKVAPTEGV